MKWNIDLGDEHIKETTFAKRKSISILLGQNSPPKNVCS